MYSLCTALNRLFIAKYIFASDNKKLGNYDIGS